MTQGYDGARRFKRALAAAVLGAAISGAAVTMVPTASAAAPAATIHPGVQTTTGGAQCTANFVYTNGTDVLLGQAAHCSGTGSETDTNGCTAKSLPLGTPVAIQGATKPGTLVYDSWLAMQAVGEKNADACAANDIALVRIDPADVDKVSATVPSIGGPTGVATGALAGQTAKSYGNSQLRGGIAALSPKSGSVLSDDDNGWSHTVVTVTPGIPGDSGSGFLTADNRAFGVLSTLNFLPGAGTNSVSDLGKMIDYAHTHGLAGLTLRNG